MQAMTDGFSSSCHPSISHGEKSFGYIHQQPQFLLRTSRRSQRAVGRHQPTTAEQLLLACPPPAAGTAGTAGAQTAARQWKIPSKHLARSRLPPRDGASNRYRSRGWLLWLNAHDVGVGQEDCHSRKLYSTTFSKNCLTDGRTAIMLNTRKPHERNFTDFLYRPRVDG